MTDINTIQHIDAEGTEAMQKAADGKTPRVLPDLTATYAGSNDHVLGARAFENDVRNVAKLQREYAEYFDCEVDGRMTEALLRDACFRAHSQVEYLNQRIGQVLDELRVLERDYTGAEVQDTVIHAKLDFIQRLERQVQLWHVIGTAGQRNYKDVTGDTWMPPAKNGGKPTETDAKARLAEVFGRFGNKQRTAA